MQLVGDGDLDRGLVESSGGPLVGQGDRDLDRRQRAPAALAAALPAALPSAASSSAGLIGLLM